MIYLIKFFLCGIFTSFLFPPFFILPIGFISIPYLFFLLCDKKIKNLSILKQFIYGTTYGLGLNLILLNWLKEPFLIDITTQNFAFFSYLLIIYVSIYFGITLIILSFFKNDFSKMIALPIVFVLTEVLRENISYGFPWITFSVISSANYIYMQIAYFVGTYGLSYFVLVIFLFPVCVIWLYENKLVFFSKIYLIIFLVLIIIIFALTIIKINLSKSELHTNTIKFSLNQLNINQFDKANNIFNKNRLDEILKTIINGDESIYIFSETDYPYIIKNNNIVNVFQNNLLKNQSIVIGGIRKENNKYYNSIFFISKNSFKFFDKKKLVPFGEFLPLRNYLYFLNGIVGNIDFTKGEKKRKIEVTNNLNFIPVICYEIIFFNDLLDHSNSYDSLLINLTNDAWFGEQSGPYQHFYLSRIRSVEMNKFLIRVSNNGITALIDNYGKIIKYIPLNVKHQENIQIDIPSKLSNLFIYHKYFLFIITIIILVLIILVEKKIERFNSKI